MKSKNKQKVNIPEKEGYYTVMNMNLKTGKSEFVRYEKITFRDEFGDFVYYNKFWIGFVAPAIILFLSLLTGNKFVSWMGIINSLILIFGGNFIGARVSDP